MAGGADAEEGPCLRLRSIGSDDQAGGEFAAALCTDPHAGLTDRDFLEPGLDDRDTSRARRLQAMPLQRPAVDDRTQVGLADLGGIEGKSAGTVGRSARVPDAHVRIGANAVARQPLPDAADAKETLRRAPEREDPQIPIGAARIFRQAVRDHGDAFRRA